jgi:hypothetical protein
MPTDPRARIEQDLAARLAAVPATAQRKEVALLCLGCRAINESDAMFCTSCGQRFNALLVAQRPRAGQVKTS